MEVISSASNPDIMIEQSKFPRLSRYPFPTEALIVNLNGRGHGAQSNLTTLPYTAVFHQLRPDSDS
jgi:hypothetical protein